MSTWPVPVGVGVGEGVGLGVGLEVAIGVGVDVLLPPPPQAVRPRAAIVARDTAAVAWRLNISVTLNARLCDEPIYALKMRVKASRAMSHCVAGLF